VRVEEQRELQPAAVQVEELRELQPAAVRVEEQRELQLAAVLQEQGAQAREAQAQEAQAQGAQAQGAQAQQRLVSPTMEQVELAAPGQNRPAQIPPDAGKWGTRRRVVLALQRPATAGSALAAIPQEQPQKREMHRETQTGTQTAARE
jgi:hypothetical protein